MYTLTVNEETSSSDYTENWRVIFNIFALLPKK